MVRTDGDETRQTPETLRHPGHKRKELPAEAERPKELIQKHDRSPFCFKLYRSRGGK